MVQQQSICYFNFFRFQFRVLIDDIYVSSCFKLAMKMHCFMQLSLTSVMDGGAISQMNLCVINIL